MKVEHPLPLGPEACVKKMGWFLKILQTALEEACEKARQLFEHEGTKIEYSHFASTVRWAMTQKMDSLELNAVERKHLNNNGLQFKGDGWKLRVLKAFRQQIPGPGRSNARRAFFYQPAFPGMEKTKLRLVALWETDETGSLSDVFLAMPRGASNAWENCDSHWQVSLEHPAKSIVEVFEDRPEDVPFDDEQAVGTEQEEK